MTALLAEAIGWTLVHFLWQGLAIAAIYGIFMGAFRTSPRVRYQVGLLTLLLMIGAAAKTFQTQWRGVQESARVQTASPPVIYQHATLTFSKCMSCHSVVEVPSAETPCEDTIAIQPIEPRPPESTSSLFYWGIGIWLTGCSFFFFRLTISHLLIQRLRRIHSGTSNKLLNAKLRQLSEKVGVKSLVQIHISDVTKVPTVIGWLRPVILVPRVSISELSQAQLDSILVHELAHIKRHDYPFNLIQHFIESAFFFHPAVWLVSASIRKEREFCCDDIAATTSRNVVDYARALATLEELRNHNTALGMAASGGSLLARIRRLGGYQPPRSCSLLIGSTFLLVSAIATPLTISSARADTNSDKQAPAKIVIAPLPSSEAAKGFRHLLSKSKNEKLSSESFADLARFLNHSDLQSLTEEVRSIGKADYSALALQALVAEQTQRNFTGFPSAFKFDQAFVTSCTPTTTTPTK